MKTTYDFHFTIKFMENLQVWLDHLIIYNCISIFHDKKNRLILKKGLVDFPFLYGL